MKINSLLLILIATLAVSSMAQPTIGSITNDIRIVNNLIQAGEIQRALIYLDNMEKIHGRNQPILSLYKQVYKAGKLYDKYEDIVLEDLKSDPSNSLLKIELGEARYLLGEYAAADSIWDSVIESDARNSVIYMILAGIKLRYGQSADAVEVYLQGRKNVEASDLFAEELASIYMAQRNYPGAVEEYLISFKKNPDRLNFVANEIRSMVDDSENPQEIIDIINRQLEKSPERDNLYEILGEIYLKQNQMEKALEGYRIAGTKRNDDGVSLLNFASRCIELHSYAAAINAINEYFSISIKKSSQDRAMYFKAIALKEQGYIEQSLGCLKEILISGRDVRIREQAILLCGQIYAHERDDCDSALAIWNLGLNSMGNDAIESELRVEMALCHLKEENISEAENALMPDVSGSEINRFNEKSQFLLGDIELYKRNLTESEMIFKVLCRKYPQGEFANDALMRLNALAILKKDSSNIELMDIFAQAMKAQVIGEYIKEGDLLSSDPVVNSGIGELAVFFAASAYQKAGLDDKARELFELYIRRYDDGLYLDRAYLAIGDILAKNKNTIQQARAAYSKILEQFSGGTVTELARERILKLDAQAKIG